MYVCLGMLGGLAVFSIAALAYRPAWRFARRLWASGRHNAFFALMAVAVAVSYGGSKGPVDPPEPVAPPEDGDKPMSVTVTGYSGKYDGAAHGIDVSVADGIAAVSHRYASGAQGAKLPEGEWSAVPPALTDAGAMKVWCETSAPGYITQTNSADIVVSRRTVTLRSGSASKEYDSAELVVHEVSVGGDGFVDGEGATWSFTGSQTEVGSSPNTFAYTMNVGTKAANYDIVASFGTLTVLDASSGVVVPGTGSVVAPKTWKSGQKVKWSAKADKGSVFSHWEGEFVDSLALSRNILRSPTLQFTVPENFSTNGIRAVFVSVDEDRLSSLFFSRTDALALNAQVEGLELLDDSLSYVTPSVGGLPSGLKFDAKTLAVSGKPTKPGAYVVKVTAKNASGYQWAENLVLRVADASGAVVPAPEPSEPKRTRFYPVTVLSSNKDAGTVSGTGVYAQGKKVSISAKVAKGFVFAGWYADAELTEPAEFASGDFRAASQSVVVPDVRYIYARFATTGDDADSLAVNVSDAATESDGTYALDLGECLESLSLPKLAVSGLPSGLKYDSKALKISGKATKPGVYTVKVSATNASVKKATESSTATFQLTVPNFECEALPHLNPEINAYGTVRSGVMFGADRIDCTSDDGWTVKVAGLPSGLKYDAKTGKITGTPTAKAGSYTVTFTASKKGAANQVATITLNVEPLPDWSVGTFDGAMEIGTDGLVGLVSLAVASNGKISGKIIDADGTWKLSAAAFDAADAGPVFRATVIGKNGKNVITNEMEVAVEEFDAARPVNGPCRRGVVTSDGWMAWQNLWKSEPWKTEAKAFAKAKPLVVGEVTLKFAASGAVTASGKFVTGLDAKGKDVVYSANCSGVLVPAAGEGDECPYRVFLHFPPNAKKDFDGFSAEVPLVWDGAEFSIDGEVDQE